jgi:hypothetical protein
MFAWMPVPCSVPGALQIAVHVLLAVLDYVHNRGKQVCDPIVGVHLLSHVWALVDFVHWILCTL